MFWFVEISEKDMNKNIMHVFHTFFILFSEKNMNKNIMHVPYLFIFFFFPNFCHHLLPILTTVEKSIIILTVAAYCIAFEIVIGLHIAYCILHILGILHIAYCIINVIITVYLKFQLSESLKKSLSFMLSTDRGMFV